MSGWSSKAEVVEVVKATIANTTWADLPRDPKAFNVAGIVRDNFASAGIYGWRETNPGAEAFEASLRKHLRKSYTS